MAWVIINWVKSAEVYGTGIVKTFWRKQTQQRMVRVERPILQAISPLLGALGGDFQSGFTMKPQMRVVHDDVDAQLLDIDEVFPDPSGSCEDTCEYMTHRVSVHFHELESAMSDGRPLYREDRLREIKKLMSANPYKAEENETLRQSRQRMFGPDKVPRESVYQQRLHLLEEWQDGKVTTIVEEYPQVKPIRSELHEMGMKPFVRLTPIPAPGDFYGISIPEVLFSLNLELNTLHNARLDTVLQNAYQMFTVLDGTINPQDVRFQARGIIPVEDHDDIRQFDHRPLDFAAYRESEALRVWAQLASGATDPFTGIGSGQTGGTATEAQLL
jgi:hypothetical protein